jgi:hypothetical protein
MNRTLSLLATALVFGSAAALAQAAAPAGDGTGGGHRPMMRERMKAAHEVCRDAADRYACMREKVCAQASDPARCQAEAADRHKRMISRMEERQAMHEACAGRRGEELVKCLGEQRRQHHRDHRK